MPSKKGKWSKTYDKHKRNRDDSKESEEPSEQNQQERKDKASPGNEGYKGACGTPADEKPDGSHRQDMKVHSGRKQGGGNKGRMQGNRETIPDPGGDQGKTQNRSSSGRQQRGSVTTVEPHPKSNPSSGAIYIFILEKVKSSFVKKSTRKTVSHVVDRFSKRKERNNR